MRYTIAKQVLWKTVDGEVVIVDPEKDDYCYLNSTGREIWESIRDGRSLDETVADLVRKYEVSPAEAKSDTEALIQDLLAAGLISRRP